MAPNCDVHTLEPRTSSRPTKAENNDALLGTRVRSRHVVSRCTHSSVVLGRPVLLHQTPERVEAMAGGDCLLKRTREVGGPLLVGVESAVARVPPWGSWGAPRGPCCCCSRGFFLQHLIHQRPLRSRHIPCCRRCIRIAFRFDTNCIVLGGPLKAPPRIIRGALSACGGPWGLRLTVGV